MRNNSTENLKKKSFLTFYVGNEFMGLEVLKVQEVTKDFNVVPVARAPKYIQGLINLRGQISTALGTRDLFQMTEENQAHSKVAIVCKIENNLFSLIVDSVGDVIEVDSAEYEKSPETLNENIKRYLVGIYKVNEQLLSILDIDQVNEIFLNKNNINKEKSKAS